MKRFLLLFLALALFLEPVQVAAQGGFGYQSNYGQALGDRRAMNRTLQLQGRSGGSFYDQQSEMGMPGGLEMQGPMRAPSGMMMEGGVGYQIHILGQVRMPGTYRVPPSTRLDEALQMAGGLMQQGSERRVELRRGEGATRYDLLQYRQFGDLNQNPFLLDNDVVFIPFAEKNVAIQGPVRSGGTYELTGKETTVWDLVRLAGGFTPGVSYESPIRVIRYKKGEKEIVEAVNTEQNLSQVLLQNGDIVVVPHIFTEDKRFDYNVAALPADNVFYPTFNDNVFVMGAVELPGAYRFNPHFSVRDYVSMAGPNRYAKWSEIIIMTSGGKRIRHPERGGFTLSPGDTIVIPQRAWTADNVIKWYNTLATSIITGFTLKALLQ